ncbi:PadR family transcriptional regulator [Vibrio coralliirubri]|uniref:PadR family transcriptional regulator n=1 Tax=Vibrio coralliirubri TaxID=1516159 RepID=UPI002284E165|nr:PadR family transcriptional regulator [Vibrio coralliirubri]MCY9861418.1 PadR family transcriptional regulator [Vibrio coralliirubri]
MDNIIDSGKKLTQLSAIIATIFAEGLKSNKSFSITGYDLTRVINNMRMCFSHQQIYRELKLLKFLQCVEVPQDGKPNKKMYSINVKAQEFINNIHHAIDFDPRKTHTKNMYAFSHIPILICAFDAHTNYRESKEEECKRRANRVSKPDDVEFELSDLHQLNCEFDNLMTTRLLEKINTLLADADETAFPKDIAFAIDAIKESYPTYFS